MFCIPHYLNYIPIYLTSDLSTEYMQMVNFVANIIDYNSDFKVLNQMLIHSITCDMDQFFDETGWNEEKLLKNSGWDGYEGLTAFPNNSKQEYVRINYFYIGKSGDLRTRSIEVYWLHQVIPNVNKREITFAFNTSLGYIMQNHPYLIDCVEDNEKYNRLFCIDTTNPNNFKQSDELLNRFYAIPLADRKSIYICDRVNFSHVEIPIYSFHNVRSEIIDYFQPFNDDTYPVEY